MKLFKNSTLTEELYKRLNPIGSRPPRLYGLPKIHKEGVPLRPVVSNIGALTYQLSKYLAERLGQLTGNLTHHVKNSFQFVQTLESIKIKPGELMVSFDVISTYFCFDGQYYEETDRVAVGSPLSPVIANFYMEDFEKTGIEQATHKPACWYRYVADTFEIWPHGQDRLQDFLNHLNGLHKKIQFTMEIEKDGHLPFFGH
jgi:hypothetical protein